MAKKRVDPIKQREKRAKVLLAVCGVFLLGAVVVEGPTFMKLFSPAKPPAAATPAPGSTTAGALALPGATAAPTTAAAAPAAGDLADTDLPPANAPSGQLVAFGMFETKNPFRPQVSVSGPNDAGTTAAIPPATTGPAPAADPGTAKAGADVPPASTKPTATTPTATTPTATTPTVVPANPAATGDGTTTTTTTTSTTPTAATGPMVTISVNGRTQRVGKNGTFPSGAPVFRLVSFTHGSAQIAIVGGSYQTGDPTLTLNQGTKVTLENTSDATRYTLLLISTP